MIYVTLLALSCASTSATSFWHKEPLRKAEYPINDLIINRWSPRAMSGDMISSKELMPLFEAARWAPSAYNSQPWRFIYAFKGTDAWNKLFKTLVPFNQSWVHNGAVLVLVLSEKTFERNHKDAPTHSFDTGAACENFALQGAAQGLVVHCMSGFDYAAARKEFAIPESYAIEAMFCVGKPGSIDKLPKDMQTKEVPSSRKHVSEIAFENGFKG